MKKAVIYCRESMQWLDPTDVRFDDQELTCRDYAREHGYIVHKVYRESHSGADLLNRTLIWEAIEDIQKKRADILFRGSRGIASSLA